MAIFGYLPAYSCLNEYKALLNGKLVFGEGQEVFVVPQSNLGMLTAKDLSDSLRKAEITYKRSGKLTDYSDYGVMLCYNNQYQAAKIVFKEIESRSPGLYATAANLGTTYELLGIDDSALYWIKKAISVEPGSHYGSEWIHVKILEAKIKAKGNSNYFETHEVLDLDFGNNTIPRYKSQTMENDQLEAHLLFQLSERMTFIKPKDVIMGQLLFDLANTCLIENDTKSANKNFRLAIEYGYHSEMLNQRLACIEGLQKKADRKNYWDNLIKDNVMPIVAISGTVLVAAILATAYSISKRRKKKN